MIPSEIFAEDLMSTLIRYGLYIGAAFQLICLFACIKISDEETEPHPYDKLYTDSDENECSSEQSSPGHRCMSRVRRQDKKKRR